MARIDSDGIIIEDGDRELKVCREVHWGTGRPLTLLGVFRGNVFYPEELRYVELPEKPQEPKEKKTKDKSSRRK